MQAIITTIKPTSGNFVSFQPRAKEGEEKKPTAFAAVSIPAALTSISDNVTQAFAVRAYNDCCTGLLRDAIKNGKAEFSLPELTECFTAAAREFLITKADLEAWLTSYAMPIIYAAIAAKTGQATDSVAVVKGASLYRDALLALSGRSIMAQVDIDRCLKALELFSGCGKEHNYNDNVAEAVGRKQASLDEFLNRKDVQGIEAGDF